ncbi:RHS repeat domain-containing protein [Agromyces silvae]|uniref:RHS repeat domain-containing protein n=1 Tax=Agromyces silvae TaxID=3388266 RepID=UPI00280AAEB5|nr:RHS repeat-associated core domain-containing protein [Agromyces protaetiae]
MKQWSFVTGAVLCAGLVGGVVSPVWAASSPGGEAGDVQLGSFALGDGLEGTIGELDGSFGFTLSAGGLQLAWDSRAAAADPVGLGPGWSFGLATLRVDGGVWVHPASGGAFAMSATSPTGLAGYPGSEVRFAAAEPGAVVPARADGSVGETPYAYVLHELGGVSTYFDAAGYPLAKLVVEGDRIDWRWAAGEAGQLVAVVGADGIVTALDWSDPSRVTIAPGSNVTDPADGSGAGGRWQVELDGGRVSAVADPVGARTTIAYGDQGLVERVSTPAGASTVVEWRSSLDAVARVDRVRVVDDVSGSQLSERRWAVEGQISPSGWPAVSGPVDLASGGGAAAAALEFETSLSDGKTRIGSTVAGSGTGAQRIMERAVSVTSASGERVVQEHAYAYAERAETPGAPAADAKPTSVTTTHHGRSGGTRSVTESYEFDELGRMVSRTSTDGTIIRRAYDGEVLAGRALPIGLVTEETTTAPDGLVSSTRYELRDDRAVVEATELWSGREGGELVRTDRVERDVEDGFVTEQRVFPGGDATAVPVVTRWSRQLDPATGTERVVQTVAAGTPIESSAVSVASLVHGGRLTESDVLGNTTVARYDEAGRQIARTTADEVRIETSYWADGSRKDQSTETGTTRFYWDGDRLINEVHEAAGEHGTASYLIGANRQARSIRAEDGTAITSYYGTDRHGNVTDLTDANGRVTTAYDYTDYGVATVVGDQVAAQPAGIGELGYNPFQYAGEYTHRDGTQPLGPRTYDPAQARFLSMDDAPLANLYAFADLNPITNVDPSGRQAQVDWNHLGPLIAGFVVTVAAGMFFAFSGGASGVLGFVGGVLAGGDAALAGFELARGLGKVQWTDPKAMEIAAYGLFATSLAMGIGAIGAKLAGRFGMKAAVEKVDETTPLVSGSTAPPKSLEQVTSEVLIESSRRGSHVDSIEISRLQRAALKVTDGKYGLHVNTAVNNISLARDARNRQLMMDYSAYQNPEKKLREVDAKILEYERAAFAHIVLANKRLTKIVKKGWVTGAKKDYATQEIENAHKVLGDALKPGVVFQSKLMDGFDPDPTPVRFLSREDTPPSLDSPRDLNLLDSDNPLTRDAVVYNEY